MTWRALWGKFGYDIFTAWLQNGKSSKLGCSFFSCFMNWNWRPLSSKSWHFEASEDCLFVTEATQYNTVFTAGSSKYKEAWPTLDQGLMWQLHMKMKQVYISYNGCCCVPGPVSEDIITKFKSQGLHIIRIKYWNAGGSGNPPSLFPPSGK